MDTGILSLGSEGINLINFILNELKNINARFDQVLGVIANDRVHFDEKWAENERKWIENEQKWAENEQKWAEFKAYSDEKWAANDARWDANDARWVADILKWQFNDIHWLNTDSILDGLISAFLDFKKGNLKFEEFMRVKIGALGARWGVATENSYRSMLESILVKSFNVEVQNYIGFDETGTVFGRPDQVELDVIIKNGILIIIELKSSVSKNDLYIFERKVRWYELKFSLKADRAIVVSPMVDRWAISVAEKLHVELFSNFDDLHLEFRKQMKA
jgi:hypothetical protein